jgi:hypothetical protein
VPGNNILYFNWLKGACALKLCDSDTMAVRDIPATGGYLGDRQRCVSFLVGMGT